MRHESPSTYTKSAISYVVYKGKDGRRQKSFDALEWLAAMCSHVPNKGEQMVRYYGYYNNVSRGKRQKTGDDAAIEDQEVIRKILTHLGLWQINPRPWPVAHAPPDLAAAPFDDGPAPSAEDYLTDPLYPDEV
jgi:hypothetical protein